MQYVFNIYVLSAVFYAEDWPRYMTTSIFVVVSATFGLGLIPVPLQQGVFSNGAVVMLVIASVAYISQLCTTRKTIIKNGDGVTARFHVISLLKDGPVPELTFEPFRQRN